MRRLEEVGREAEPMPSEPKSRSLQFQKMGIISKAGLVLASIIHC